MVLWFLKMHKCVMVIVQLAFLLVSKLVDLDHYILGDLQRISANSNPCSGIGAQRAINIVCRHQ